MKNTVENEDTVANTSTTSSANKSTSAAVKTIRPEWDVPACIKVYSSTRVGGVSEAPYDSLNVGSNVDDNPQHVNQNRQRLVDAIKAPDTPHWLNQVHGREVAFVDCYYKRGEPLEMDGSFTREQGQVLAVSTADCLPVVIANAAGTAVSVMHAGWRGLADGVLQSGMAHFPEEEQLHAWLGPAIGATRFEVGTDVVEVFLSRDKENAAAFKPVVADTGAHDGAHDLAHNGVNKGGNKFMADIYLLAKLTLKRHRNVKVTGGDYCTYSQPELFHSYRRDGAGSGRMATVAWIE